MSSPLLVGFGAPRPYADLGDQVLYHGDSVEVLAHLPDESVSLVLTDPPYGWDFLGKDWDKVLPDRRVWAQCLRALKPGGFMFVFAGARLDTLWRLGRDLEETGFSTARSPMVWYFMVAMSKGQDVGQKVDKAAGAPRPVVGPKVFGNGRVKVDGVVESGHWGTGGQWACEVPGPRMQMAPATDLAEQWDGWRYGQQTLKPLYNMVLVAQKPPPPGPAWRAVVEHGAGAYNFDACRIPWESPEDQATTHARSQSWGADYRCSERSTNHSPAVGYNAATGRAPSTVLVTDRALGDHSKFFDVDAWACDHVHERADGGLGLYCPREKRKTRDLGCGVVPDPAPVLCDSCGAVYPGPRSACVECYTPDLVAFHLTGEKLNQHPTPKPVNLMAYLATLGCPPGGLVLDPFMGSGSSSVACAAVGARFMGVEWTNTDEEPWLEVARRRTLAVK